MAEKAMSPEKKALLSVICALGVFVVVVISMRLLAIPDIDSDTLCPVDQTKIPLGDLNILLDRTDALSTLNQDVARQLINKWRGDARPFERMNLFVLNSGDIKKFSRQITVCAPPTDISLQFAKGRTLANQLLQRHRNLVDDAVTKGLETTEIIGKSRIIEALRQITNSTWPPKSRLLVISDLIEISDLANFFGELAPDFDVWKTRPNAVSILNEIMLSKENSVQVCEFQMDKPDHAHRGAARMFWQKFFFQYGISVKASCSEVLI